MNAPRSYTYGSIFPLSEARPDVPLRLVRSTCGRGLAAHLAAMGLRPGAILTVIRASGRGPMIIGLGDNRMALGRGMAHRVFVAPADGNEASARRASEK